MSVHQEIKTLRISDLYAMPAALQPKKSGEYIRAGCPFHGSDKGRSLSITESTGLFRCFSCGAWGYTEEARERYRRDKESSRPKPYTKPLAALKVAHPPTPMDRGPLRTLLRWQAEIEDAKDYLDARAIPLPIAKQFGLGFCPPGQPFEGNVRGPRIVAPHTDIDGNVVSLYSRACESGIKAGPTHYHLKGRAKGLFNAQALRQKDGPLFVCEGVFDALSLLSLGYRAVAIFGLAGWRWDWCQERELVLALDADQSANKAVDDFAKQATMTGVRLLRLTAEELGGCKDVNEAHSKGVLRIDIPSAIAPQKQQRAGRIINETPPEGFPLDTWLNFVQLCAKHHPGSETWTEEELYSLPPNPRLPMGAGALWIAANFSNLLPEFTEDSLRLNHLVTPRQGLNPSGKLPESGR